MARAAQMIEKEEFDLLDINMGCPVPKIVNNHEGSALMKDPALIEKIVAEVRAHTSRPVTVKIRKGFNDREVNAVELAKRLEDAGAAAIAVHGRTREQYYSGKADWDIIRQVKAAVRIPVIGNGDVKDRQSALAMLEMTGCDGVMIGRAAEGNPWIFRQILHGTGKPDISERKEIILRHAQMTVELDGEYAGIRKMRKHVAWYTAGCPHSAKLRAFSNQITTLEELRNLLTLLQ
jgi:nifR3 family TIM-barrel protein